MQRASLRRDGRCTRSGTFSSAPPPIRRPRSAKGCASLRPSRSSSDRREMTTHMAKAKGSGTKDKPWVLQTPPGTSEFEAYRDEEADPPALVVQVGKTQL